MQHLETHRDPARARLQHAPEQQFRILTPKTGVRGKISVYSLQAVIGAALLAKWLITEELARGLSPNGDVSTNRDPEVLPKSSTCTYALNIKTQRTGTVIVSNFDVF